MKEAWDHDPQKRPTVKRIAIKLRGDLNKMSNKSVVLNRSMHMRNQSSRRKPCTNIHVVSCNSAHSALIKPLSKFATKKDFYGLTLLRRMTALVCWSILSLSRESVSTELDPEKSTQRLHYITYMDRSRSQHCIRTLLSCSLILQYVPLGAPFGRLRRSSLFLSQFIMRSTYFELAKGHDIFKLETIGDCYVTRHMRL
jgi:hypothetical protein